MRDLKREQTPRSQAKTTWPTHWGYVCHCFAAIPICIKTPGSIYEFSLTSYICKRFNILFQVNASDVIILEGILVLHDPRVRDLMNMKIFVDAGLTLSLWLLLFCPRKIVHLVQQNVMLCLHDIIVISVVWFFFQVVHKSQQPQYVMTLQCKDFDNSMGRGHVKNMLCKA